MLEPHVGSAPRLGVTAVVRAQRQKACKGLRVWTTLEESSLAPVGGWRARVGHGKPMRPVSLAKNPYTESGIYGASGIWISCTSPPLIVARHADQLLNAYRVPKATSPTVALL